MQRPASDIGARTQQSSTQAPQVTRYRERPTELRETLTVLRHRKWSIVSVVVTILGFTMLLSSRQTPIYASEASVLVAPVERVDDRGGRIQLNIATEVELASSVAVAFLVAKELVLDVSPRDLIEDLSVASPEGTEIIRFTYRHPAPEIAQERAQGFADGYLEYRRRTTNEILVDRAEALEEELVALRRRVDKLERELRRISADSPRAAAVESEASLLQGLILQRQLDRLALTSQVSGGSVVQPAGLSTSQVSPNLAINSAAGLILGLILGLGVAFLRERLAGPLRTASAVELQLGAPVLGVVPRVPYWRKHREALLVTQRDWTSPASEAYRIVRTNLQSTLSAGAEQAKTILVTSAHSGEGKTTTAANLGVAFARAARRTVVISADLRRPRLHEFFRLPRSAGLADVITGRAHMETAISPVSVVPGEPGTGHLSVLISDAMKEDTAELLAADGMLNLLRLLRERFDIVIIDAPPLLPVTDSLVLSREVDGVLLVIGPRSATSSEMESTRQQLDKVRAHLLGAVLNGPEAAGTHPYSYVYE